MGIKKKNRWGKSESELIGTPSWFLFYCVVSIPVFWVAGAGRDLSIVEVIRQGLGALGFLFLLFFCYGSIQIRRGGLGGRQWNLFWLNLLAGSTLHENPNTERGDDKAHCDSNQHAVQDRLEHRAGCDTKAHQDYNSPQNSEQHDVHSIEFNRFIDLFRGLAGRPRLSNKSRR